MITLVLQNTSLPTWSIYFDGMAITIETWNFNIKISLHHCSESINTARYQSKEEITDYG